MQAAWWSPRTLCLTNTTMCLPKWRAEKSSPVARPKARVKEKCTICGATRERELDALGHAWNEGEVTSQPQPGVEGQRNLYLYTVRGAADGTY